MVMGIKNNHPVLGGQQDSIFRYLGEDVEQARRDGYEEGYIEAMKLVSEWKTKAEENYKIGYNDGYNRCLEDDRDSRLSGFSNWELEVLYAQLTGSSWGGIGEPQRRDMADEVEAEIKARSETGGSAK